MSALETKSVKKVFTKTVVHRALQHKIPWFFPQVVCPLTMCDFEPQLFVCVSTFPQKNLTSSFDPLVLSGRDASEDLLDKSLSILWKLGTLVIPTITKKNLKIKLTKYLQWRGEIKPNSLPIEMYYNVLFTQAK